MKKTFLILVVAFIFSACSDSGSSSSSSPIPIPPPVYKDSLTFIENSVLTFAIIRTSDALLTDRPSQFKYLIENFTINPYNNISFSIDPENSAKYSISAQKIDGGECTSLQYGTGCIIFVDVVAKAIEDINIKIKMASDRGEVVFPTKTIKTAYTLQPTTPNIDLSSENSKIFTVINIQPARSWRFIGSQLQADHNSTSSISMRLMGELENNDGNFTLNTEAVEKEVTQSDGSKLTLKNCLAANTIIDSKDNSMCYVNVEFSGPAVGAYSDTLTIKHVTAPATMKYGYAKITLSATK